MSKNMENHIELKQKYHMDRLLKALLTEQKHNKCLEDKIRRSKMEHESAIQQYTQEYSQRLERLEHENQQLKTQMCEIMIKYQRLNEFKATSRGLTAENWDNLNFNYLWEIKSLLQQPPPPPPHPTSSVYVLGSSGYKIELHLQHNND